MTKPSGLTDVGLADIRPPGPTTGKGFTSKGRGVEDQTYYLLKPDVQFYRPWLHTPGGTAFIWPMPSDGFQITSNATTGIHHYIGSNGVDVDIVYPDELHIVMTGTFPGKTSIDNMHALRSVILQTSTEEGKILALPGIWPELLYVQIINHQFNHDTSDSSSNVTYSMEGIKVGTGHKLKNAPLQLPQPNPTAKTVPRGKGSSRVVVRQSGQTIRSIAEKVYGDSSLASQYNLMKKNQSVFDKAGIPSYKLTSTPLPTGLVLEF